jgi:hypothetical protein
MRDEERPMLFRYRPAQRKILGDEEEVMGAPNIFKIEKLADMAATGRTKCQP